MTAWAMLYSEPKCLENRPGLPHPAHLVLLTEVPTPQPPAHLGSRLRFSRRLQKASSVRPFRPSSLRFSSRPISTFHPNLPGSAQMTPPSGSLLDSRQPEEISPELPLPSASLVTGALLALRAEQLFTSAADPACLQDIWHPHLLPAEKPGMLSMILT